MFDLASLEVRVEPVGVTTAASELDSLAAAGGRAARSTSELEASVTRLAGRMTLLAAGTAALRVLNDAVRATSQFNASLSQLSAITGAAGRDLNFLATEAGRLAMESTASATAVVDAFRLIAGAKADLLSDPEGLVSSTQAAITLAEASGEAVDSVANALASALNQFGAGADQANRFINVLAAGTKEGAASVAQVAESLRMAGTVASAAGLSFEETNAALQQLSQVATMGSEAGTSLRMVLLNLETQSEARFKPSIVGFSQALHNLRDANLSTGEAIELFGVRNVTAGAYLVDNAGAVAELTERLTGTRTAHEQARDATNNLTGDMGRLHSAIKGLQIQLASDFDPTLRNITQGTTGVVRAFTDYLARVRETDQANRTVKGSMDSLAGSFGPASIGLNIFTDSLGALGRAIAVPVAGTLGLLGIMQDIATLDFAEAKQEAGDLAELLARLTLLKRDAAPTESFRIPIEFEPVGFGGFSFDFQMDDTRAPSLPRNEILQRELEAVRDQNAAILATVAQRYENEAQQAQRRAADSLRELATARGLTEEQERLKADMQRQIVGQLHADLAAIDQRRLDEQQRVAEQSVRIAQQAAREREQAERLRVQGDDLLGQMRIALVPDDQPLERDRLTFEAQMRQRDELAARLFANDSARMTEYQLMTDDLRARFAQESIAKEIEFARQRDASILQVRAEQTTDPFEAERLRLEASLMARRQYYVDLYGTEEEAIRQIEILREAGHSRIEQMEIEAAARARQIQLQEQRERIRSVADTLGGVATIFGAESRKVFAIQKAAAVSSALLNVPETASDAYKWGAKYGGPVLGATFAAAAVAAQVANAAAVQGVSFGGGGGGGVSAGGGGVPSAGGSYAGGGGSSRPSYSSIEGFGGAPSIDTLRASERFPTFPSSIVTDGVTVTATVMEIAEPAWNLPALSVDAPLLSLGASDLPSLRAPDFSPLSVATPPPLTVRPAELQAPALPSLLVQPPSPLSIQTPDPLAVESRAFGLEEPSWTLPGLTVEAPDLTVEAPTIRPVSLVVPDLPSLAVPTLPEPGIMAQVKQNERLAAEITSSQRPVDPMRSPFADYGGNVVPIQDPRRDMRKELEAISAVPAQVNVQVHNRIELRNESGTQLEARTESLIGPDGEQVISIILNAVADDVARSGAVGQAIKRTYGLQQRLGLRG